MVTPCARCDAPGQCSSSDARERKGAENVTTWGIWYDAGDCDMGWLNMEGSHGRPTPLSERDPADLYDILRRQRARDAQAVQSGWPATTFVVAEVGSVPMRCLLGCPKCCGHHVDEGEWASTRKHRTHQCQTCMHEWRPFAYPTIGVAWPAERAAMEPGECGHDPTRVCLAPKEKT